jgi:FKBP-type peptidyl-prolyl cis-trans isomerase 2
MKLEVQSSSGTSAQAIVLEVTDSDVTLDLTPPLAGKALLFDLELLEIVQSNNR